MKTCYYELLGVSRDATDSDLKKAYRKKALQYHPDKNRDNVEEATEIFATIKAAYEVLSDPQERAWYDSHREQILSDIPIGTYEYDDGYEVDSSITGVTTEELLMFFNTGLYISVDDSPAGLYQIAGKVFAKLANDEVLAGRKTGLDEFLKYQDDHFEEEIESVGYVVAVNARLEKGDTEYMYPTFGCSTTPFGYLKIFYKKWSNFSTLKSFSWKDKYMYSSNYDRRTKREVNKRNEKARTSARNEYNKTVRRFVSFIKKLDKRMAIGAKKAEEERIRQELKRKEEHKRRQREARRNLGEQTTYEEQSWQVADEPDWDELAQSYEEDLRRKNNNNNSGKDNIFSVDLELEEEEEESDTSTTERIPNGDKMDFSNRSNTTQAGSLQQDEDNTDEIIVYECTLCKKKFKSENQMNNHMGTKLHKKNLAKVQRELKKENIFIGMNALSDADEFDSANSNDEQASVLFDITDENVIDLEKIQAEIAELERQLEAEDSSSSAGEVEKEGTDTDIDIDLETDVDTETSSDKVKIENENYVSSSASDIESVSAPKDSKGSDTLDRLLNSLDQELKALDSDSDDDWSLGNRKNKKKGKNKPKSKDKNKGREKSSTVENLQGEEEAQLPSLDQTTPDKNPTTHSMGTEVCATCGARFSSRNKLFQHVKAVGHAAPPSRVEQKKSSKKKAKMKASGR